MKYIILLSLIFLSNITFSKSSDSPDLSLEIKNDLNWNQWLIKTKKDLSKNFDSSTLKHLDELSYNPKVIELDRKQPEFKLTFNEYVDKRLTKNKRYEVRKKYNENKDLLDKIEALYNVDPRVIISLWGIETSFGSYIGKFNILRSLASLAYDGRIKDFFYKELKNALTIIDNKHIKIKNFKGSWAGAFGQTQFMPSTFMKYAVDFNNDKKINLFQKDEALASAANYLTKIGWKKNLIWGEKINLKINDKYKDLAKKKVYKNRSYWESNGIMLKKKYNDNEKLRLITPDSVDNQSYLVTSNFDVILRWNRSNYFALVVFLLSDEIK